MVYQWTDCPVLTGLDLGELYQADTTHAQGGDSQEYMAQFYVGMRGALELRHPPTTSRAARNFWAGADRRGRLHRQRGGLSHAVPPDQDAEVGAPRRLPVATRPRSRPAPRPVPPDLDNPYGRYYGKARSPPPIVGGLCSRMTNRIERLSRSSPQGMTVRATGGCIKKKGLLFSADNLKKTPLSKGEGHCCFSVRVMVSDSVSSQNPDQQRMWNPWTHWTKPAAEIDAVDAAAGRAVRAADGGGADGGRIQTGPRSADLDAARETPWYWTRPKPAFRTPPCAPITATMSRT